MQIPEVIQRIVQRLGHTSPEEVREFLAPTLAKLPHPRGLKGNEEAAQIVSEAIINGEEIVIWGDYDVDGTTATALLVTFLRELGVEPLWHIPNRLTEGYGVNLEGFSRLHQDISTDRFIFITVDCGIANRDELARIKGMGGKVIVTDHHQLPLGEVPDCLIVNPNQDGCDFEPYKLAGVGVAFYLAAAIRAELEKRGFFAGDSRPNMKEYLGFVALGTVADLVDLTPANRTLIRGGTESLKNTNIPGLTSLLKNAELGGAELLSEDIAFSLAPRINAAGRLGSAEVAVRLLTCDNISTGIQLSKEIENLNNTRKGICSDNLDDALSIIRSSALDTEQAIVVAGDFHSGVIGIVASKLVDIYGRPAIVFSREELAGSSLVYKGSGRSIEGLDLLDCLHKSSEYIEKYGGHTMAAGLTVTDENFMSFSRSFCQQVSLGLLNRAHGNIRAVEPIEVPVDEAMRAETLQYYLKLEPFGPLNERPIFFDSEAAIVSCKKIGGNKEHLQLTIRGKTSNYKGVGFGLGERYQDIKKNPVRKISYYPSLNRYLGKSQWQLRIVDIS